MSIVEISTPSYAQPGCAEHHDPDCLCDVHLMDSSLELVDPEIWQSNPVANVASILSGEDRRAFLKLYLEIADKYLELRSVLNIPEIFTQYHLARQSLGRNVAPSFAVRGGIIRKLLSTGVRFSEIPLILGVSEDEVALCYSARPIPFASLVAMQDDLLEHKMQKKAIAAKYGVADEFVTALSKLTTPQHLKVVK